MIKREPGSVTRAPAQFFLCIVRKTAMMILSGRKKEAYHDRPFHCL